MKKPNEPAKTVEKENGQNVKISKTLGCCGPACCGNSIDKRNSNRKEK